jgi:hypothetical protein
MPSSASNCTGDGDGETDASGHSWSPTYKCINIAPTSIYGGPNFNAIVDTMTSATSWFACKTDSGFYHELSVHPTRWLWTRGDINHVWGWMPDSLITSETNSVPDCPSGMVAS